MSAPAVKMALPPVEIGNVRAIVNRSARRQQDVAGPRVANDPLRLVKGRVADRLSDNPIDAQVVNVIQLKFAV